MDKVTLRKKIINVLKEQGFNINPHLKINGNSKKTYKRIQAQSKLAQLAKQKHFLQTNLDIAKFYLKDGVDINPENISLELREVMPNSLEEKLYRWWNYIWWSIPYQRSYGRQMRFLLWDTFYNSPFGLICLQSPVLKMAVRDKALGIPNNELDIWVNRSMNAQRVGALPPYNELLGGKMVALSLTANEIREIYKNKYKNYTTIIKNRKLQPELLFITTTSAFGKSSIYNRLRYNEEKVAECLGYTKGSGTFHIPDNLYEELINFLSHRGINVSRGYGHGPSRKLKLISIGLKHLGLPKFEYHGIEREFYLFPLVKNLREVIQKNKKPIWINRPFTELVDYWKKRWAIPRAERISSWKEFKSNLFFKKIKKLLAEL